MSYEDLERIAQSLASRRGAEGTKTPGVTSRVQEAGDGARLHDLLPQFEQHPVVRALGRTLKDGSWAACLATPTQVWVAASAMLPFYGSAAEPVRDSPVRPSPRASLSACCMKEIVQCADKSGWACSGCGQMRSVFLSDDTPYRYFAEDRYAGKADPNHWSFDPQACVGHGAWSEVDQLLPYARHGRAHPSDAEHACQLLGAYTLKNTPSNRWAAAAAALIIIENPLVEKDRRVGTAAADLPVAPFACCRCGATFHVRKDLRFHTRSCRGE